MTRLTPLALTLLLLLAGPALAKDEDLGSESQVSGYGQLFAYVIGAAVAVTIILVTTHVIRSMIAEANRGKKKAPWQQQILDEPQKKKKKEELFLGEKVPDWKIKNRLKATKAALKLLAVRDGVFDVKQMTAVVERAVGAVKTAIEERSPRKIQGIVTKAHREELEAEIKGLAKSRKLHIFGEVELLAIDVVHVEAPDDRPKQGFVALVALRSKDYLRDEKSGEVLRGDKKTYTYQEFWCFKRSKDRWLLKRIRASGDMDFVLKPKNLLTPVTLKKFAKAVDEEYLREFTDGQAPA